MARIVNLKPLSNENRSTFDQIWNWFVQNQITGKDAPQVTSDKGAYHCEGLIGINEDHLNDTFPITAVMLEELLHYVATQENNSDASSDFSPEFLHFILDVILVRMTSMKKKQKQEVQSSIICVLWKIIEGDIAETGKQPIYSRKPIEESEDETQRQARVAVK